MILYIVEPGSVIKKNGNRIQILFNDEILQDAPLHLLESLVITGKIIVTNAVLSTMLLENINVIWIGFNGKFIGRLQNVINGNIHRRHKQFQLYNNEEKRLNISKNLITGKTRNQRIILMRYNKYLKNKEINIIILKMHYMIKRIKLANTHTELMGIEGYVAKLYYKGIGKIVPKEFMFSKRSKFPSKDAVNSILSFGYTLLYNDITNILISKNMDPCISVLHSIKNGHHALSSDLMEEWRPIIIDSMAINMFKNGEFSESDFIKKDEEVQISLDAIKKFIKKYETKMHSYHKFINVTGMDYRSSMEFQINKFIKDLENNTNEVNYTPILIR